MDDIDATSAPGTAPAHVPVDQVVEQVRHDLAARRRAGELPHLPAGELDRQFSAVIEAVDAGLVEEAALDPGDLAGLAVLETWRPPGGGLTGRLTRPIVHVWSRLVGALVRRQVEGFSRRVAYLVETLIHRQNRLQVFLARTHLDRLRGLEHRVAELEREVEQLRGGPPPDPR
ncbi:MAG TPA: hypothetical protein VHK88_01575 [Aquihabitans sp.]|jgi:hypothetical protein|nr:hypothetical protein [Aquihabitans sp.]